MKFDWVAKQAGAGLTEYALSIVAVVLVSTALPHFGLHLRAPFESSSTQISLSNNSVHPTLPQNIQDKPSSGDFYSTPDETTGGDNYVQEGGGTVSSGPIGGETPAGDLDSVESSRRPNRGPNKQMGQPNDPTFVPEVGPTRIPSLVVSTQPVGQLDPSLEDFPLNY